MAAIADKVTDKEEKLLALLAEDPSYTMNLLAKKMSVSRKTIAIYLKALKDKGILRRIGSDRKGYWKIIK